MGTVVEVARGKRLPWVIGAIVVVTTIGSFLLLASAFNKQSQTDLFIRQHFGNVLVLRQAEALMVDAETGQRGFLLTSQPSFLDPYNRARSQLPSKLNELVNAGVDARGDALENLRAAKLGELALTLQLAQHGRKDAAVALVAAGKGKRLMDALRVETARRERHQQALIDGAIVRSERYAKASYGALAVLIVSGIALLWLGLSMAARAQTLEAETVRLREVEQAQRQTALVARELNHRVKNLFSIVLAIVQLASRGSSSPKEVVSRVRERIQALARAHEVSLGHNPMSDFDLETMLRTLLAPYSSPARLELGGPPIHLPVMRVTPIGLLIHELATNAVKYGAWSGGDGKVTVDWSIVEADQYNGTPASPLLRLRWDETRADPLQTEGEMGFGSKLINSAVAQLDGSIVKERSDNGVSIVIDAPIVQPKPGSSQRGI
jgi:two-component sensor histidine kinase